MLEAISLTCTRGDKTLFKELSFQLPEGQLLYLRGHNGAGKTTLLRAVCGLTLPRSGEIHWERQNIRDLGEEYHRHLHYLGHFNGLKDSLTGLENVRFLAAMHGDRIADAKISDAFYQMGVEHCQDLPVKVLSQGQKRRIALARLICSRAKFWILDEPFTALDSDAVALLLEVIRAHVEQGGMVLLTTHQEVALDRSQVNEIFLGKR